MIATGVAVSAEQAGVQVDGRELGGGRIYGPSYLPTGEPLYNPGSAANAGSYADTKMTSLITSDDHRAAVVRDSALAAYANYARSKTR